MKDDQDIYIQPRAQERISPEKVQDVIDLIEKEYPVTEEGKVRRVVMREFPDNRVRYYVLFRLPTQQARYVVLRDDKNMFVK